ncbi:MAG TPA: gamma-glutamyltransferase [Candidatus Cybelea sp.]|nr:gamma-glutamyltransferase [Candidatus Cybelea sp.]
MGDWRGRDFQAGGRSVVVAGEAAAATSHPLATLAAIETLRAGGTAIDAAICAAAVLAVVEPESTGIGGDCFVLMSVAGSDRVMAYNGAGRAGAAADPNWFLKRGIQTIDPDSIHAVTVPGAVEAWCRLAEDHGRLGIDRLLQPAIHYAEQGFGVTPRVAFDWQLGAPRLARHPTSARLYLKNGKPPQVGDRMQLPNLAKALREILWKGKAGFYEDWVAEDIVRTLKAEGSLITLEDLAAHRGEYALPIKTSYRGLDVWECPPPGQGLTALLMLNILSQFPSVGPAPLSPERLHLEIEAAKLAYAARDRHIADPDHAKVPVEALLSQEHAKALAREIDPDRAMRAPRARVLETHPDTVYLTVVDRDRNAVSFINSLYYQFGSARATERSGMLLQNRGACFRVEPNHPNCIGPSKRSMHTIIPAMVTGEGRVVLSFGVMGGDYQPMGQVHILTNLLDFGMDPQAAIDCPRVHHEDGIVGVETGIPEPLFLALSDRGHKVLRPDLPMGGGQAIAIDWKRGVLLAGSDSRKDGCALGF